ncbi:hypothetical protein KKC94_03575, partial [Patescibacteria group bacterium]|nr:hypothetical protein [Patescibacteria group bacterium]
MNKFSKNSNVFGSGRPAYSLIYAFFIMTIIMMVAATTIQDTSAKLRIFQELEAGSKARLAAESSADLAILALKDNISGFSAVDENSLDGFSGFFDNGVSGEWEIVGTAQENNLGVVGNYYTPIPNTGSAAPYGLCMYGDAAHEPGHSCNWNKIKVGESVTIPLFAADFDGSPMGPNALGMLSWKLLVRTPCSNGSFLADCGGGARYVLNVGGGTYAEDPSVVSWQLIGFRPDGTSAAEMPSDAWQNVFGNKMRVIPSNTEIYKSLVNTAANNVVLEASSTSPQQKYRDLYNNFTNDASFESMILQLDIVSELMTATEPVPYL